MRGGTVVLVRAALLAAVLLLWEALPRTGICAPDRGIDPVCTWHLPPLPNLPPARGREDEGDTPYAIALP